MNQEISETWKQRYRAPSIYTAAIAPLRPERGLIWTNQSGSLQFHAWDVPSGQLRALTSTPGGQAAYLNLSPDGEWVYFLRDEHGNEIGHFARMPYAGGEPQEITPDLPPHSEVGFGFARSGSRLGFGAARPDGFTIYVLDAGKDGSLGPARELHRMQTIGFGPFFSADGSLALVASSERSGKNEFSLLAFDARSGRQIAELWDGEGTSLNFNQFSPLPGDGRVLATTNRSGIERLLIWDPLSGQRQDLELDVPGAQGGPSWSPDGERILVSAVHQAIQSLYVYHLKDAGLRRLDAPPGGYDAFYTPDGGHLYALWNDSDHNSRLVELDEQSGRILSTLIAAGQAPAGRPFRSVEFPSSDGEMIQAWLGLPEGQGPFPTLLDMHGGPTAVKTNGFDPSAQAWLDHGFAYLSINYRGSITFGREFEQKIWHDLGHWEVEDMAAAQAWLVREGIARPQAVFLTGWSYGGYLTLQALGKRPDLWAGGMAGIAIADWAIQWEDTADTLRGYQEALFGGTPQEQPERYRASSPISYAEAVRAPVLIIQGLNDTRTPARPVHMYEEKLRALGKPIEVVWFETGHMGSFADTELGIQHQEKMMRFALDVLQQHPV